MAATQRDIRLDFFRGLGLLFIFLDHIPDNYFSYFTLGNFVFCDAAELFVFISGYSAALVFGSSLAQHGNAYAAVQVVKRCWTLYVAHIFLFVLFVAQVSYTAAKFDNPMFLDEMKVADFLQEPHIAVLHALALRLQPPFMDILPLYIVLLLGFAIMLPLLRRVPMIVVGGAFLLYIAATFTHFNLGTYPSGSWFFNPFTWQMIFVLGAAFAMRRERMKELAERPILITLSAGFLAISILVRAAMDIDYLQDVLPLWITEGVWIVGDKTSLGPLRLLNFLALVHITVILLRPDNPIFRSNSGRTRGAVRSELAQHFLSWDLSLADRPFRPCRNQPCTDRAVRGIGRRRAGNVQLGLFSFVVKTTAASARRLGPGNAKTAIHDGPRGGMMERRILSTALAAGISVLFALTAAAADKIPLPVTCEVPSDLITDSSPLPNSAKQIRTERRLKIVALGSSSTLGMGASGPSAAYPARLEAALQEAVPNGTTVQVINKGVARQSAEQMLDRLASDVFAEKPALVVWEIGTSEAVRGAEVDQFMLMLLNGIDRMTAAGMDVLLIDTQYSRNTAQLINFQPYVVAIEQVAGMRNLVLFPRYSVMRHWTDNDRFDFTGKSPQERRQITDEIYDCVGRLVARGIEEGLKRPR